MRWRQIPLGRWLGSEEGLVKLSMGAACVPVVMIALVGVSCASRTVQQEGLVISLVETGEVILADEHVSQYVRHGHRIILTKAGIDRWESYAEYDRSRDPEIRKLGKLTQKEFSLTIDGVEMYRGNFWSMLSSMMTSGVLLYDTAGVMRGGVCLRFTQLSDAPCDDPRDRPEIIAHFRKIGKLVEKVEP